MLLLLRETMISFSSETRKTDQREKVLQYISLVKTLPMWTGWLAMKSFALSKSGTIYQVYLGGVGSEACLFACFYNPSPYNLQIKIHLLPLLRGFLEPSTPREEPPTWQNRWHLLKQTRYKKLCISSTKGESTTELHTSTSEKKQDLIEERTRLKNTRVVLVWWVITGTTEWKHACWSLWIIFLKHNMLNEYFNCFTAKKKKKSKNEKKC